VKKAARQGIHFPLGHDTAVRPAAGELPPTGKCRIDPSRLARPLTSLSGVGPATARRLGSLGLTTVGDLLLYLPFRHEAPAELTKGGGLRVGKEATVRARVRSCHVRTTRRRGLRILEALVADESGSIVGVWYNQDYLCSIFERQPELLIRGQLSRRGGRTTFVVRRHEVLSEGPEEGLHTLGLVPVYPATGDVSVRTIRTALARSLPEAVHLVDPLPARMLAARGYLTKADAVLEYHFPQSLKAARRARARLAYEELLLLQVALLRWRRSGEEGRRARALGASGDLTERLLAGLPYAPTAAQRRVMGEVDADLTRSVPMRRLLQGDVGAGKTLVAVCALLRAVEEGGQAAVMVPTEVLADQHFERLSAVLDPLGVPVHLLKGSQRASERKVAHGRIAGGEPGVYVGTHALIQTGVSFKALWVLVVDEQHRFGVRQRDALVAPGADGSWPHTLHMTATPIPRTLSLTLYGDLDVSVIDELPPGRRPVITRLVAPEKRGTMWDFVRRQLDRGRQAYVVCPLVDDSPTQEAASAKAVYERLAQGELAAYRVRLLHGQLPAAKKQAAMRAFSKGGADVLVATTVIEVGIDVPNAAVLVVEDARRFGLSQLHQLRGRVGRGAERSFCLLLAEGADEEALERLRLFASTTDGFSLAEADLRARGEGQLFGERQSGFGDLRVARLLQDQDLVVATRSDAGRILAADPEFLRPEHALLAAASRERFGERAHWLDRA
jgi:ATP-dependent DNA helicase RecG